MEPKIGESHFARKALFRKGMRQGYLTVAEIEEALPAGVLTPAERWLLYYSLRASEIEVLGDVEEALAAAAGPGTADLDDLPDGRERAPAEEPRGTPS